LRSRPILSEHVELNKFAFKPQKPTPYPGCLRRPDLIWRRVQESNLPDPKVSPR
jgi:hypothetical protein